MNPAVAIVLVATSFVLAALRVGGEKGELFQAVAHLWVGGLVGAWLTTRRRLLLWSAVALSLVELGCFLFLKP